MKARALLLLILGVLTFGACAAPEESEIAYCVDREGRVLEEERCESDRAALDAGDVMLIYFLAGGGTQHHYHYGQTVPIQSARRAPSGSYTVRRASEVVKIQPGQKPLRFTPAPPKPAGWSVKTTPKTTPKTAKPTTTSRPVASRPVSGGKR